MSLLSLISGGVCKCPSPGAADQGSAHQIFTFLRKWPLPWKCTKSIRNANVIDNHAKYSFDQPWFLFGWAGSLSIFQAVDTAGKRCFSWARKEFLVLLALIYQTRLRLNLDKHYIPDHGIDKSYVEKTHQERIYQVRNFKSSSFCVKRNYYKHAVVMHL